MNEDIKDQIDLCKTALRRAMGHLARMEFLFNQEKEDTEEKITKRERKETLKTIKKTESVLK